MSASQPRTIADILESYGISREFISRCNDEGLLTPGLAGGRTVFLALDELRLQVILRGLALGFTLAEIRELIAMGDLVPAAHP